MTISNKFSFALNRGFDKLYQPSKIISYEADNNLRAAISYFSIERNGSGGVDVAKEFGTQMLDESEISEHRAAYQKVGNHAYLDMLDKVEVIFKDIHSGKYSVDDKNGMLHQETEDFYQKYLAGEVITQTYAPMARNFIPDEPENPEHRFLHKRALQKWDDAIGQESEIPHDRIKLCWGLE